jgi:hypothetical protein
MLQICCFDKTAPCVVNSESSDNCKAFRQAGHRRPSVQLSEEEEEEEDKNQLFASAAITATVSAEV